MPIELFRFFCGYVRIKIRGDYPERFLNVCSAAGITLWGYAKTDDGIAVNIAVSDYLKIRSRRRKSGVSLRITKKRGLPFALKKYSGRIGIAVGAFLFLAVQVALSQFIWNVEIKGNKSVKSAEIEKCCKSIGIGEGTLSSVIDTNDARLALLLADDRLSWASFIVEGSHLTVNVSETKRRVERADDPTNFVAARDGVIEKVTVSGGKAVVKSGQPVLKGELLASGVIEYTDGTTVFTRCDGRVTAKTKRSFSVTVPKRKTVKKPTGRIYTRRAVKLFGIALPLSFTALPESCETTTEKYCPSLGESYLPVVFYTVRFSEYEKVKIQLSSSEAVKLAQNRLKKLQKAELADGEITEFYDTVSENDDSVTVLRRCKCTENIAISENIKINTVKMQKNVLQ